MIEREVGMYVRQAGLQVVRAGRRGEQDQRAERRNGDDRQQHEPVQLRHLVDEAVLAQHHEREASLVASSRFCGSYGLRPPGSNFSACVRMSRASGAATLEPEPPCSTTIEIA